MLKFFSRLERTRNFVLFAFAAVMVASLVLFYAPTNPNQQTNLTLSNDTAAKVGSETVTVGELATQKQAISQLYGIRAPSAMYLVNEIVDSRIMRIEAARLGLTATNDEVREAIRKDFTGGGRTFNQKDYEQNVADQYGSVTAYEQIVRDRISSQKLQAYITSGVSVSEQELLDGFKKRETKFDLNFVSVSVEQLTEAMKPTDGELQSYFASNKDKYKITLPQKKIRYIFVNTNKIGEKLTISDEELKAEYDKLPADRKQAGVQGQQVVLKIGKPEFEQQVLAKANEIVQNARRDGGKISAEAFGEIAKGQSEDAATAQNGGNLRGLVRSNPNNPDDPYQKLLTMQPGDVSEPIKYNNNYYILRRGEAVPKTFEDAKKEIEVSLKNRRSYAAASEVAQKVADSLKQTKDVQKTAAEFAAQTNSTVGEMVRETGFLKPGDDVPNIGVSPQFETGIAPLETVGDVGEKTPIRDGFAIPMLVEKRDPRDAEFAEVKEQVAKDFKFDQAKTKVEQIAKDIAADATNIAALAAAAQSRGLKVEESKNFILGSPLGTGASAATSEALQDAIYNLKAGETTKTPIKVGDNYYVVGLVNRVEPNMDEFAKQRDLLSQTQLAEKRSQVMTDYLTDLRTRMQAENKIKIYKEAIEKIDAADKDATAE